MITEILVGIILAGVLLIFVGWRLLRQNRVVKPAARSTSLTVEEDKRRIRDELEDTADEIIERMAMRIDRLETLLREADRKSSILQKRLDKATLLLDSEKGRSKKAEDDFAYLLEKEMTEPSSFELRSEEALA